MRPSDVFLVLSAIFEYLDSKLVIQHGPEFAVMTNSPVYDEQVDLTQVDLSEGTQPSKLLVSGQVDLAGDVTAKFTPAEPYAFLA